MFPSISEAAPSPARQQAVQIDERPGSPDLLAGKVGDCSTASLYNELLFGGVSKGGCMPGRQRLYISEYHGTHH